MLCAKARCLAEVDYAIRIMRCRMSGLHVFRGIPSRVRICNPRFVAGAWVWKTRAKCFVWPLLRLAMLMLGRVFHRATIRFGCGIADCLIVGEFV